MEEVRQGTCRESGLGHAGNGQRGNGSVCVIIKKFTGFVVMNLCVLGVLCGKSFLCALASLREMFLLFLIQCPGASNNLIK
jgi:hypothetical protein